MNTDDRALADLKDEQSFKRIMSILDAIPDTRRDDDLGTLSVGALRLIRSRLAADRLEAFHAKPDRDAVEQGARALARFYHPDADQDATSPPLWFSYLGEANAVLQTAALQSPPPVVSGEARAIVARVAEGERSDDGHTALRDDAKACLAALPVVEEGRREAIARLTDVARFVSNMWVQMPLTYRRQNGDTNLAAGQTLNDAILALTPVEGVGGWIIGNSEKTHWRVWENGIPIWTKDRAKATRYARREDAEAVHAEDEDAWTVEPYSSTPVAAQGEAPSVNQPAISAYTNTVAEGEAITTPAQGDGVPEALEAMVPDDIEIMRILKRAGRTRLEMVKAMDWHLAPLRAALATLGDDR